jgi:hypothetical protein
MCVRVFSTAEWITPDTKGLGRAQVICGVAYDNSRVRYKRWVGARDPNGNDIVVSMHDAPVGRRALFNMKAHGLLQLKRLRIGT